MNTESVDEIHPDHPFNSNPSHAAQVGRTMSRICGCCVRTAIA